LIKKKSVSQWEVPCRDLKQDWWGGVKWGLPEEVTLKPRCEGNEERSYGGSLSK